MSSVGPLLLTCSHCHSEKPPAAFWRNRSKPTGRQDRCIKCCSNYEPHRKAARRYSQAKAAEKLIANNLDLVTTLRVIEYRGLAYLCLVRMANLHASMYAPEKGRKSGRSQPKFRALVKLRTKGAIVDERAAEQGYRQPHRGPRERREICLTDCGVTDWETIHDTLDHSP